MSKFFKNLKSSLNRNKNDDDSKLEKDKLKVEDELKSDKAKSKFDEESGSSKPDKLKSKEDEGSSQAKHGKKEKTKAKVGGPFFLNLYEGLAAESKGENVFFCPLSVEIVLSLAYCGAGGNTQHQLRKALLLPESQIDLFERIQSLLNIANSESFDFHIANALYLDETCQLNSTFVDKAATRFEAHCTSLNFESEASRKVINDFVEKHTGGMIPDILSQGTPLVNYRLLIISATYFKASWFAPFDPMRTQRNDFHLNKKQTVSVDFMVGHCEMNTNDLPDVGAWYLLIPYLGYEMSFIAIVPEEIDGLSRVEKHLHEINFQEIPKGGKQSTYLKMPKFKIEETVDLKEVLKHSGITDMFGKNCDFSGISEEELYCSTMIHKTKIIVDEKGTEAASADIMTFRLRGGGTINRTLDRPFIFYVWHHALNKVIFMGKLVKPKF